MNKEKKPINSATEATAVARDMINVIRDIEEPNSTMLAFYPIKAWKESDKWYVLVDVGVVLKRVLKFEIDAESGDLLRYGPA
ncbi:MAG: hypothetical protein ACXADD_18725 [Candidatus Thorarchaeota archaeon]